MALFYDRGEGGKWFGLGRLLPGIEQRIDNAMADPTAVMEMNAWLTGGLVGKAVNPNTPGRRGGPAYAEATPAVIKRLLFHEDIRGSQWRNAALRQLDQSWRLHHKEEVVVFGRVARSEGAAEEVATHPGSFPA